MISLLKGLVLCCAMMSNVGLVAFSKIPVLTVVEQVELKRVNSLYLVDIVIRKLDAKCNCCDFFQDIAYDGSTSHSNWNFYSPTLRDSICGKASTSLYFRPFGAFRIAKQKVNLSPCFADRRVSIIMAHNNKVQIPTYACGQYFHVVEHQISSCLGPRSFSRVSNAQPSNPKGKGNKQEAEYASAESIMGSVGGSPLRPKAFTRDRLLKIFLAGVFFAFSIYFGRTVKHFDSVRETVMFVLCNYMCILCAISVCLALAWACFP